MNRIPAAVLGATGIVGQRLVAMLADHPWFEIAAVCASNGSAGATYADAVRERWKAPGGVPPGVGRQVVRECVPDPNIRLAFSALDAAVAGPIETAYARAGCWVSSNARNHRMEPGVPLIIPEVNASHLGLAREQGFAHGGILTNPNCSTAGLALALAPLHRAFGVERVFVTTMQALSGAGYPGVASLDILGNVLPYICGEEEKMETEPLKILGEVRSPAPIRISAQCNRVASAIGHLMTVAVELGRKAPLREVRDTLDSFAPLESRGLPTAPFRPLVVQDDPDRPQPLRDSDVGGGMSVSIGRLRPDPVLDYRFVLLVNNLVRGAAGAAILNAELLVHENMCGEA